MCVRRLPRRNASQPAASAALAGARRFDVYTGIDVFGRDTFGGGGYNCNRATDVIAKVFPNVQYVYV